MCFPPSTPIGLHLILRLGSLNIGFASLALDFRAQRESWALNIGFGPLTLDFRAQRESKAILCLFSVAVCFSGRIKAEIPMPKQPLGRQNAGNVLRCRFTIKSRLQASVAHIWRTSASPTTSFVDPNASGCALARRLPYTFAKLMVNWLRNGYCWASAMLTGLCCPLPASPGSSSPT